MGYLAIIWLVLFFSTPAFGQDFKAEIDEWVTEPCMEVAAALGVKAMKREQIDMGIKRQHVAKLMVASRDASTRKLARQMRASATWEQRRAAYPLMLKICIGQLEGMK